MFTGNPFINQPLVIFKKLVFDNGHSSWNVYVTVSEDSYLGYVRIGSYLTAIPMAIYVPLIAWQLYQIYQGNAKKYRRRSTFTAVMILLAVFWVVWIITIKYHTTVLAKDALDEQAKLLSLYLTSTFHSFFTSQQVTAMSYFFGFLPLDSNRSWLLHNTDVDAHLYNRLAELPDATAYFSKFRKSSHIDVVSCKLINSSQSLHHSPSITDDVSVI